MGDVTICLGVMATSSLFHDKSLSPLANETTRKRIYANWILFGQSVFRKIRRVQRNPLLSLLFFSSTSAQSSQYSKVGCFVVGCPGTFKTILLEIWSFYKAPLESQRHT
jgi:hypothetical protein